MQLFLTWSAVTRAAQGKENLVAECFLSDYAEGAVRVEVRCCCMYCEHLHLLAAALSVGCCADSAVCCCAVCFMLLVAGGCLAGYAEGTV
jgi:hypothetical protein